MNGLAIILSGASGTGKSTILTHLRKAIPSLMFSVSCTTRNPRPGEIDGKDYFFISKEAFLVRLGNNEFIEHAEVHGNYYGTLKTQITDPVLAGNDVLLDIDVQGAQSIRKLAQDDPLLKKNCLFLFIAPPSFEELERRLRGRGTETEASLEKRLKNAKEELKQWRAYDYIIVNDDAQKAASQMEQLLAVARLQTHRMDKEPFNA